MDSIDRNIEYNFYVTMTQTTATYWTDANRVPLTLHGVRLTKLVDMTGNNETVTVEMFRVYGICRINSLYGVVTQALGANHTTARFRAFDGTTAAAITAAAGTTLSAAPVGSLIQRRGISSATIVFNTSATCNIMDLNAATAKDCFTPFNVGAQTAGYENIQYVYATTDTPTTGRIQFYIGYNPISEGAYIEVL